MKSTFATLILAAALVAAPIACSSDDKKPAPPAAPATPIAQNLSAEDAVLVSITATVESIDTAKREVTLKGPKGNLVTCTVDKAVKRLDEIKVGDSVTADYYASLAFELRAPTEEEKKEPLVALGEAAKAPKNVDPAAGGIRAFRAVCTVTAVDLTAQTATLKGPRGNEVSVQAKNPENLKKVKVGDTVIVTYTEAIAISVEKKK